MQLDTVLTSGYTPGMIRCRLKEYVDELAKAQARRKYSVREIADGAGVPPSVVQGLLADKFANIGRKTIDRICNYLKCQPGDWLVWLPVEVNANEE